MGICLAGHSSARKTGGSSGLGINQNLSSSVVYCWHRGREHTCAISLVGKTYFLVHYLLFTVYWLAKQPVNRSGGSANVVKLQEQGQLAWGYATADPSGFQEDSGGHNSRLQSVSVDLTPVSSSAALQPLMSYTDKCGFSCLNGQLRQANKYS